MARSQKEKKKEYWERQFFDIERKGNGACRAERMDGPSGDRTNTKAQQKNCKNLVTEITFSSSFSYSLKSNSKEIHK